ncbi:MAG: hypothetical protein KIS83_01640 [Rubrivivax sp.]|nr:hypothetical protein [Rubrivivax sp.]
MRPQRITLHVARLVVDGPVASRSALQAAVAEALQRELAARWSAQAQPAAPPAAAAPRWTAPLADAIAARWSPAADPAPPTVQAWTSGAQDV